MRRVKRYVKARLKQVQRRYLDAFHAFSPTEFVDALRALRIRSGDIVFVHSSYDAFQGFTGKPTDVIAAMQSVVGPSGGLLMPTLPFGGTAIDYVRFNPVFDVRRTPSHMGLLTELFRRSRDVVRSVHPTHPVALWGDGAAGMGDGHHLAGTPCGRGSPYVHLLDRKGRIVLLGTGIRSMTLYHTIEELLEGKLPFSPFTAEVFALQSRDYSGSLVATQTRLFDPVVSRRRNLLRLIPELKRIGAWQEATAGKLHLIRLDAEDVFSAVDAMAERGEYCYD
jgi:aminoglycoside 3-N-acetyltransferase